MCSFSLAPLRLARLSGLVAHAQGSLTLSPAGELNAKKVESWLQTKNYKICFGLPWLMEYKIDQYKSIEDAVTRKSG